MAPRNSITSPVRFQLVTCASAASRLSSPLWRSAGHCVGCIGPGTMLMESSATLAWPRKLAHQRSIEAAPLASISMIGTRLERASAPVEHQFAIEGKGAFAGGGGQQ